jgi:hypothetical protein
MFQYHVTKSRDHVFVDVMFQDHVTNLEFMFIFYNIFFVSRFLNVLMSDHVRWKCLVSQELESGMSCEHVTIASYADSHNKT